SQPKDRRDWKAVEDRLKQFKEIFPAAIQRTLLEARVLVANNKAAEARESLQRVLNRKSEEVDFWSELVSLDYVAPASGQYLLNEEVDLRLALVSLEQRQDNLEAADRILSEGKNRLGDRIAFRLASLSLVLAREKNPGTELLRSFEKGIDEPRFNDDDRIRLLSVLGDTARDYKQWSEARRFWGSVAKLRPNDLTVRLTLFEL